MGHGLLLTMEKGTDHRTGLDLLAAGALLALGLNGLLATARNPAPLAGPPPGGLLRPAPAAAARPERGRADDQPGRSVPVRQDRRQPAGGRPGPAAGGGRRAASAFTGTLLLLPLLALALLGRERVLPLLQGGKAWLLAKGDPMVGLVSLALAAYLGWQGIEGLRME